MERQPKKKSAAAGEEEDRISELPDEILHSVLIRIPCPLESARTSLLSRRWKYLWRSYPIVECYDAWMGRFQRFSDSTVKRFSLGNLLRMESLKIKFEADEDSCSSCAAEQLLDLASKRKAEHVEVSCYVHLCRLPFKLLSNSSARILRLETVKLLSEKNGDDLHFSLISLRFLHLHRVKLLDEWIFTSLIASSPVLETLKLEYVWGLEKLLMPNGLNSLRLLNLRYVQFGDEQALLNFIACCPLLETLELECIDVLRKFRISNFLNLKKLEIFNCLDLEEVEIVAPKLRSFHLGRMRARLDKKLSRLELVAPQLNVLEMRYSGLNMVDINTAVSKLQSLTSLTLEGSHELEEIELDASPCLHKFVLRCSEFFLLDSIKKCEIRSFAGTCRWEADFEMRPFRTWFASFRNFIARFSEFQTINFRCYYCPRSEGFASKMKDLDFATRSLAIQHLRIEPHFSSKVLLKMLLDGLFWTCRPRFLTMSKISYDSDMLFEDFLSHYLQKENEEGFDKHHAWQYRLKNVKIVARGVDHVVQKENGLMGVPENVLTWLKTQNEVRFVLTWD